MGGRRFTLLGGELLQRRLRVGSIDPDCPKTNNLEWYDPQMLITENGSLKITLAAERNHDMDYMGGMMSTWNKFCFTGGLIVANVMLPGRSDIAGLWPAVWTMGNLGALVFPPPVHPKANSNN